MSVRRMSEFILTDDNFTYDVDQFIDIIEFKLNNLSKWIPVTVKMNTKNFQGNFLKVRNFSTPKYMSPLEIMTMSSLKT